MLWQLSNGNILFKISSHTLDSFDIGNFLSETIRSAIQSKNYDDLGTFVEIKLVEQFDSVDALKIELLKINFEKKDEKLLKTNNGLLGEIVETFGPPVTSDVEDYFYMFDLYFVRQNKLLKHIFSEVCHRGFHGDIRETLVYNNLRALSF
jgi:hypothetical protein